MRQSGKPDWRATNNRDPRMHEAGDPDCFVGLRASSQ
jgi:hypothetical protein